MSEENTGGRAGVVKGDIVVINPRGDGRPALLYPAEEGLTVIVNGKLLESPLEVFEEDIIEITPLELVQEARCTVRIPPGAYTAELTVYPRSLTRFRPVNMEMSRELKLKAKKDIKLERIVTLGEADEALKEKNVVFGIDYALLKDIVNKASGKPVVVAKGRELLQGANGYIEFLATTEIETITHDENLQNNVDLRERYRFPVVGKGELIARVHPPVPGVSGQLVTGRIVVPRPVRNARFKCGEGVDFLEEKGEIVAARDGRLMISGGSISVANLITHNGDVDLESGNIHFNGDIRIYGNIVEGMLVEAKGSLFVEGSGYGAVVKAGRGIHFTKNLIKCQVEGGLFFVLLEEVILLAGLLEKEYAAFLEALQKIISSLIKKGGEPDRNFFLRIIPAIRRKMTVQMNELLSKIESTLKDSTDKQFESLKKIFELLRGFLDGAIQIDEIGMFERIGNTLRAFLVEGQDLLKEIPPLNVSYIQNSVLSHGGDINVVGVGSYYSSLQAGGNVTVTGICRGGMIRAGGDVRVKEFLVITSESIAAASHIRIRVPAHSFIYFDQVHEDVVVQIGKIVYRFESKHSNVKIGCDAESGMLKLVGF